MLQIKIYTKKDCHLCDEAKTILAHFSTKFPLVIDECDIEKDHEALERYKDEIPVVFLEGRKLFKYRIDEKKLETALQFALKLQKSI